MVWQFIHRKRLHSLSTVAWYSSTGPRHSCCRHSLLACEGCFQSLPVAEITRHLCCVCAGLWVKHAGPEVTKNLQCVTFHHLNNSACSPAEPNDSEFMFSLCTTQPPSEEELKPWRTWASSLSVSVPRSTSLNLSLRRLAAQLGSFKIG